jgi:hypothetical protein
MAGRAPALASVNRTIYMEWGTAIRARPRVVFVFGFRKFSTVWTIDHKAGVTYVFGYYIARKSIHGFPTGRTRPGLYPEKIFNRRGFVPADFTPGLIEMAYIVVEMFP